MRISHITAALAAAFTLMTATTNAATHYVYSGQSIQAKIDIAVAGDEIIVADGDYVHITTANKAITIRSVNGAAVTTIVGGWPNRCATLGLAPSHTNTVLDGFTLRHGDVNGNGGGALGGTLNDCIYSKLTSYCPVYAHKERQAASMKAILSSASWSPSRSDLLSVAQMCSMGLRSQRKGRRSV